MTKLDLIAGFAIALIGLSLLVVWLSRQTTQARRTRCEQKQIALHEAIMLQEQVQHELPGWVQPTGNADESLGPVQSWSVTILPWIGQPQRAGDPTGNQTGDANLRGPYADVFDDVQKQLDGSEVKSPPYVPAFVCPEDPRMASADDKRSGWLSYVVNSGRPDRQHPPEGESPDILGTGVFLDYSRGKDRMTLDFISDHDGESYTLLLSENIDAGLWTDHDEAKLSFLWNSALPRDGDPIYPTSQHLKGANAIFVGGNTEFLSINIDVLVLRQMMTSDRATDIE